MLYCGRRCPEEGRGRAGAMRYRFGDYQLDTDRHALEHAGVPVKLERKVYQVLTYLVQHREHLVPRAELLEHVWPGVYVAEAVVTRCIAALRKAVGDDRERQHVIQTLHGQGYRFVVPVSLDDAPPSPAAIVTSPALAPALRSATAFAALDTAVVTPLSP